MEHGNITAVPLAELVGVNCTGSLSRVRWITMFLLSSVNSEQVVHRILKPNEYRTMTDLKTDF